MFQVGAVASAPWLAFLLLLLWSAIEATIFTFTLRPTMNELLADLTGFEPNPIMLSGLLIYAFFRKQARNIQAAASPSRK